MLACLLNLPPYRPSAFTAAEGRHDGGHDVLGREQPREGAYVAGGTILLWREIGIFVAQQETYLCFSGICVRFLLGDIVPCEFQK